MNSPSKLCDLPDNIAEINGCGTCVPDTLTAYSRVSVDVRRSDVDKQRLIQRIALYLFGYRPPKNCLGNSFVGAPRIHIGPPEHKAILSHGSEQKRGAIFSMYLEQTNLRCDKVDRYIGKFIKLCKTQDKKEKNKNRAF